MIFTIYNMTFLVYYIDTTNEQQTVWTLSQVQALLYKVQINSL